MFGIKKNETDATEFSPHLLKETKHPTAHCRFSFTYLITRLRREIN